MSQINYDAMSDAELKQYFLKHRGDQAALQAHLDRINRRPLKIIASPGDPDFDEKVQAAIRQKLDSARNSAHHQADKSNAVDG
jgi:hypothetical protein